MITAPVIPRCHLNEFTFGVEEPVDKPRPSTRHTRRGAQPEDCTNTFRSFLPRFQPRVPRNVDRRAVGDRFPGERAVLHIPSPVRRYPLARDHGDSHGYSCYTAPAKGTRWSGPNLFDSRIAEIVIGAAVVMERTDSRGLSIFEE